jgi:hypothetical protein
MIALANSSRSAWSRDMLAAHGLIEQRAQRRPQKNGTG